MTVLKLCLYFSSTKCLFFFFFKFVYSFIYFTISGYTFSSAATNTTAYLFYSNCIVSEEPAVDVFLQQSHFENCCWSQALSLVLETERKFMAENSSKNKVFLPEKKVFFNISVAAASFPRWLTWKL